MDGRHLSAADLRALVTIEAWQNPRFARELKRDARQAVERLAARLGMQPGESSLLSGVESGTGALALPPSPVGPAPAELRRVLAEKQARRADELTTRIELSPEQREAIRLATGKEVAWLELTEEALKELFAPGALRAGMGPPSTWDC